MNKLKSDEVLTRTANFIEQLVIDNFEVTDPHEFLVLASYYKNTEFYNANKDKIKLEEYKNLKDVYLEMIYKIRERPIFTRFIVAGLFPVMYDKYKEMTK